MSGLVKKGLGFDDIAEYYWTDSQVVIGYVRNTMKIFVANRVQQIRESIGVLRWRYIPSKMNPVDYASGGLTRSNNEQLDIWFNSPEFCGNQNFNGLSTHPCKTFKMMILKLERKSRFV